MNQIQKTLLPLIGAGILALLLVGCDSVASIITPQKEATYTLGYDANGATAGSAPVDTRNYLAGETAAVAGNTGGLVKTGFQFSGWNTQPDGLGTNYSPLNAITIGRANVTLYARWTSASVLAVTYFSNGATAGAPPVDTTGYQANGSATVLPNSGLLVKTGSSFIGWNTAANGSGVSYLPGSVLKLANAGVDLYAQWTTAATFSVTYSSNGAPGGTVPTDTTAYLTGAEVTVKANSGNLNNPNFTFGGWSTAAGGGTVYQPGASFVVAAANVVLFAVWTPVPTYSVTYDANGGTGSVPVDATSYQAGQTALVLDSTGSLAKTGATFAGWNTAKDGTGATYTKGQTLLVDANKTLFAVWTTNQTYTITYDGNGSSSGTVPTDRTNYETGASVTVQGNNGALAKAGSTFTGWNTAANGTGTAFGPGTTLVMAATNLTLYAVWSNQPTYKVVYASNGATSGSIPVDGTGYLSQAGAKVLDNIGNLVKTGSTFTGWNTAANGSGTSYAAGATLTLANSDVTLYAVWTAIPTYSVTYNANGATGGTVPTDAAAYLAGATITVLGNPNGLVNKGYTFSGWSAAADGTLATYGQGATFTLGAAPVVLYAVWTIVPSLSVVYDGNGSTSGTVPIDTKLYTAGQTATVLGNTGNLAKTGSSFTGWNTAADGKGTTYAVGATATLAANLTLYAVWTTNATFTVTYNANTATGGSVPVDGTAYETGAKVGVLGNTGALVKKGFGFTGWNTAANGTGTSYGAGATFVMGSANVVLYAVWSATTYSVTYNANGATGGTVPTDSSAYLPADTVTVKTNTGTLVKTGSTFAGWNTAANGSGTNYPIVAGVAAPTFAMGSGNVTLYAQWNVTSVTVTGALTTVNVVYNSNDAADSLLAQKLLQLLSTDLRLTAGVTGSLNVYNVNLVAQSAIPTTFSSTYALAGGLIILTPGTTIGVYPGANVGAGQNLVNQKVPVVAMGGGVKLFDDVTANAASWLAPGDPASTALGYGPSASGSAATSIMVMTKKSTVWSSPLALTTPPTDGSAAAIFTAGQSWYGVYNPSTVNPAAGVAFGNDPTATSYVPVERQGRFLHWGYLGLPDTTAGRLFFLNLVNQMLTPLSYTFADMSSSRTVVASFATKMTLTSLSGNITGTYPSGQPFTVTTDGSQLHPGAIVVYKNRNGNFGVFTVTQRGLYTGNYTSPNLNLGLYLQYTTFSASGTALQQANQGFPILGTFYGNLQGVPAMPNLVTLNPQPAGQFCATDLASADFSWSVGSPVTVNGPATVTLNAANGTLFYVYK